MIKELNKNEIDEVLKRIDKLRNNEYYKHYFEEGEDENYPDKAYLINEKYYVDFTFYDEKCFMGVLNLEPFSNKSLAFYEVLKLFNERLKHYKKIHLWCKLENEVSYRFHKFLKKRYRNKHILNERFSILEVFNEKFKR